MIFTDAGGNKVRIDPKDFSKFSRTNATFSRALLTAYNSNFLVYTTKYYTNHSHAVRRQKPARLKGLRVKTKKQTSLA